MRDPLVDSSINKSTLGGRGFQLIQLRKGLAAACCNLQQIERGHAARRLTSRRSHDSQPSAIGAEGVSLSVTHLSKRGV